jgi:hypothetical protein
MSWGLIFRLRQQLKGNLWALPFLGAVLGPLLGQVTVWLDQSVQVPGPGQSRPPGPGSRRRSCAHAAPARSRPSTSGG